MFSASFTFAAPTGLTLKWSLSAAGTLHATLRNQTTGFTEQGTSGLYEWVASTIPDGYRGCVVWHTNTLTALADLVAATTYGGGSINPGEIERPEMMVLANGTVASTTGATTTLDTGSTATADLYIGSKLVITGGTGAGQERIITAYSVGRVATHAAWTTNPNGSSTYAIMDARASTGSGAVPTAVEIAAAVETDISSDLVVLLVAALAGQTVTTRTFVQREHIELYRGDAYQSSEGVGRRISFTLAETETHWPTTLTTVHFYAEPTQEAIDNGRATALQLLNDIACTITQATGASQAFYLELTSAQTDDLSALAHPHDYEFQIVANKATNPATIREGTLDARQPLRTVP